VEIKNSGTAEKINILLVDDEEHLAEMEKMMLTYFGYEVTAVIDVFQAIEIFKSNPHKFHRLITDYTMPDMTGLELAKELITIRSEMKIILCTGVDDDRTYSKIKAANIVDIITKPVTMDMLAEAIQKALNIGNV